MTTRPVFLRWTFVFLALIWASSATSADYTISQESISGYLSAQTLGQSFTTVDEGHLEQIDLFLSINNHSDALAIRIYSGSTSPDDASQALCEENFSSVPTQINTWHSFVVTNAGCRLVLGASTVYTVEVIPISSSTNVAIQADWSDPYSGGVNFTNGAEESGRDLAFRIHISNPVPVELRDFSVE
jgi:hypothetical protein